MELNTNFRFNKAGQGLFYTGQIKLDDNNFYFCYDCGSLSSIKTSIRTEIDDFKNEVKSQNNNKLDLLIISHFDSDHVNFLRNLCEGLNCKKVIIPYIEPIERLTLALTVADIDVDYIAFLNNPFEYLANLGFEEIVVIFRSSENDISNDNFPIEPDDRPPNVEQMFNLHLRKISQTVYRRILATEAELSKNNETLRNLSFYSDAGFLSIFYAWKFKFYVKERTEQEKWKLKELFLILLNKNIDEDITTDEIVKLFNNLKVIREIYRESFKGNDVLNSTSLVVLHRPFNNFKYVLRNLLANDELFIMKYLYLDSHNSLSTRNCTLLLSDANLLDEYSKLIVHFSSELEQIETVQIPHHGSRRSWNRKILTDLPRCSLFVINYGIGNRYGHPALQVIYDIKNGFGDSMIFKNNELASLNIIYKVFY